MPIGSGATSNVSKGVYKVRVASLSTDVKEFAFGKRAFLSLEVIEGDKRGERSTWSLSWDTPEFWGVMQHMGAKTTRAMAVGMTSSQILARLDKELADRRWTGSVRVNDDGWCDGVVIPNGVRMLGAFAGFTSRDEKGLPISKEKKGGQYGDKKKAYFRIKAVGGAYDGLTAPASMAVTVKYVADKDILDINEKSAVRILGAACGIDWEALEQRLSGEGAIREFFRDPANPLPELERMMLEAADKGHRVSFEISESGWVNWDQIRVPSPDETAALDMPTAEAMRVMMDNMAKAGTNVGITIFTEDGNALTDGGKGFARQTLAVMLPIVPGVARNFTPADWKTAALALVTNVFGALAAMPVDEAKALLASAQAFEKWVKENFSLEDSGAF